LRRVLLGLLQAADHVVGAGRTDDALHAQHRNRLGRQRLPCQREQQRQGAQQLKAQQAEHVAFLAKTSGHRTRRMLGGGVPEMIVQARPGSDWTPLYMTGWSGADSTELQLRIRPRNSKASPAGEPWPARSRRCVFITSIAVACAHSWARCSMASARARRPSWFATAC